MKVLPILLVSTLALSLGACNHPNNGEQPPASELPPPVDTSDQMAPSKPMPASASTAPMPTAPLSTGKNTMPSAAASTSGT